jgi:hypothetical protein
MRPSEPGGRRRCLSRRRAGRAGVRGGAAQDDVFADADADDDLFAGTTTTSSTAARASIRVRGSGAVDKDRVPDSDAAPVNCE